MSSRGELYALQHFSQLFLVLTHAWSEYRIHQPEMLKNIQNTPTLPDTPEEQPFDADDIIEDARKYKDKLNKITLESVNELDAMIDMEYDSYINTKPEVKVEVDKTKNMTSPLSHTLQDMEVIEERELTEEEYQIEIKKIQEYKCDKSTASIRIRTEVGTTTIKVNDTTTILDVIQHINYLITSKGKELKNAKLQDTKGNVMNENKEEVVKTLKNKKLFNTVLRWV